MTKYEIAVRISKCFILLSSSPHWPETSVHVPVPLHQWLSSIGLDFTLCPLWPIVQHLYFFMFLRSGISLPWELPLHPICPAGFQSRVPALLKYRVDPPWSCRKQMASSNRQCEDNLITAVFTWLGAGFWETKWDSHSTWNRGTWESCMASCHNGERRKWLPGLWEPWWRLPEEGWVCWEVMHSKWAPQTTLSLSLIPCSCFPLA